jgi:CheY-like chemotaxis protein
MSGRRIPQNRGERVEPWPAVGIGERRASPHLSDVGRRMKVVGVEEGPAESSRQPLADLRLAGAAHAHDDHNAGADAFTCGSEVFLDHAAIVAALRPHVVLLAMRLPGKSGLETLLWLKNHAPTCHVLV